MTGAHPFDLYLAGEISAPVAVARLLLDGASPEAVAEAAAVRRTTAPRWRALDALVARGELLARAAAVLGSERYEHVALGAGPDEAVDRIARAFDRLVAACPELSVAAYSLGDLALFDQATREIVDWLRSVTDASRLLDLGCGIGRMATALAGSCTEVVGTDISPAMITEARRRCTAPNVRFELTDGRDLRAFADAAFDLVLAVDSFPYLVQAGGEIAARHFAEAARVLRPGGAFAILNLSYRTPVEDASDAHAWAAAAGLKVRILNARPFKIWDGAAFLFDRR